MKRFITLLMGCLVATTVSSKSLIILDEGFNTQQRLDIPISQRGSQGCSSMQTAIRSEATQATLLAGSLCADTAETIAFGEGVSEFTNTKKYVLQNPLFQNTPFEWNIRVRGVFDGLERGEHGNWVSNAAYDFEDSIIHRLWQVFGMEINPGNNKWVTVNIRDVGQVPGETIALALDEIGIFDDPVQFSGSEQIDLGAIVMSLGANAGGVSDLRCGAGDGQASVDLLYSRGIAVVVALPNVDVPSDKETWPACLDKVIKVGGEKASSRTGIRQIGVGANGGIDFFAKDTTNDSQEGNSFAAPRVASAYALLHRIFPFSTVDEKTEALNQADTLTDTYKTSLVNGQSITYRARKLRSDQLAAAITYLSDLYPPQDDASSEFSIEDGSSYGPFFGSPRPNYNSTINFRQLQPAPKEPERVVRVKAGTGVLSSRRDVRLSFSGVFGPETINNSFRLSINGRSIKIFSGYAAGSESTREFIINRNFFNDDGDNLLVIAPLNEQSNWGISNVSMEYLPAIELTVGQVDTGFYGYEQVPTRYTGLRATFDVTNVVRAGYSLSATGFDIDRSDETEVFLNGVFIGNLSQGPSSSQFGDPDTFNISASLVREGTNYLEFVQRGVEIGVWSGFEDEKWGVKDISIMGKEGFDIGALPPIIFLLLDEN